MSPNGSQGSDKAGCHREERHLLADPPYPPGVPPDRNSYRLIIGICVPNLVLAVALIAWMPFATNLTDGQRWAIAGAMTYAVVMLVFLIYKARRGIRRLGGE